MWPLARRSSRRRASSCTSSSHSTHTSEAARSRAIASTACTARPAQHGLHWGLSHDAFAASGFGGCEGGRLCAPGFTCDSALLITLDAATSRSRYNVSHHIHSLSFGVHYPNRVNPLDDAKAIVVNGSGVFQYFVKVVPTTYKYADAHSVDSCQYSVTDQFKSAHDPSKGFVLPGVFFIYDISPIMVRRPVAACPASQTLLCPAFPVSGAHPGSHSVSPPSLSLSMLVVLTRTQRSLTKLAQIGCPLRPIAQVKFTEKRTTFTYFLTSLCAIVGGVFTVAGVLDAAIYQMGSVGGSKKGSLG